MSGMASEQLEALIAAQKEIIAATWKLDARAAGSGPVVWWTSSAIATAQTELKTRAAERVPRAVAAGAMANPAAGRGVAVGAGVGAGRPSADPMARRSRHDAGDRSVGGATDRRRYHSRWPRCRGWCRPTPTCAAELAQQAGGRRWLDRQGRSLSAFFDQELQRQQETNYETPKKTETRPDRPERNRARHSGARAPAGRAEPARSGSSRSRRSPADGGDQAPA